MKVNTFYCSICPSCALNQSLCFLTAASTKMTQHSGILRLVEVYRRFVGAFYLHHQGGFTNLHGAISQRAVIFRKKLTHRRIGLDFLVRICKRNKVCHVLLMFYNCLWLPFLILTHHQWTAPNDRCALVTSFCLRFICSYGSSNEELSGT
jgi:hypothetical protein